MTRQTVVKQLRKKYGTVRKAAESRGVDIYKLRNVLRRMDYNKGINAVSNPKEDDIDWLKSEFGL